MMLGAFSDGVMLTNLLGTGELVLMLDEVRLGAADVKIYAVSFRNRYSTAACAAARAMIGT